MTVAVQQPQQQESDLDKLYKAIGVATNIYGVVLDKQRQDRLDEMTGKKLTQDQIDRELVSKEKAAKEQLESENREIQLDKDFALVAPGTEGAIKLPRREGLFLPRPELARRDSLKLDKEKIASTANEKKVAAGKQGSEVSYRYNMLQSNADKLKGLVNKHGTMAVTGSAGTEMDSAVYQMAVDYAKLVDPESVAREGEVASAKKYMLPFRDWGGATTSNETAIQSIENYKKSLDDRLVSRISALEQNGQDASSLKDVLAQSKNSRNTPKLGGDGTAIAAPAAQPKIGEIKQDKDGVWRKRTDKGWEITTERPKAQGGW